MEREAPSTATALPVRSLPEWERPRAICLGQRVPNNLLRLLPLSALHAWSLPIPERHVSGAKSSAGRGKVILHTGRGRRKGEPLSSQSAPLHLSGLSRPAGKRGRLGSENPPLPKQKRRIKKKVVRLLPGRFPRAGESPCSKQVFSIRLGRRTKRLVSEGGSSLARLGLSRTPPKLKKEAAERRMAEDLDKGQRGLHCTCKVVRDATQFTRVVIGKCHERWRF